MDTPNKTYTKCPNCGEAKHVRETLLDNVVICCGCKDCYRRRFRRRVK